MKKQTKEQKIKYRMYVYGFYVGDVYTTPTEMKKIEKIPGQRLKRIDNSREIA